MEKPKPDLSFILNHLGENREEYYGAVSPPLFQSTNYCFSNVSEMREKLKREMELPFYTRGFNPTVGILRQKVAALEGAEDALVFSSGSAAIACAVMSVLKGGDHVVCVKKPYSWTNTLLQKYLPAYGIQVSFTEGFSSGDFEKECRSNTKLIYLESPNSLTFELQDISAIATFARSKGILTLVDNSYNSPLNQSPIEMGADLVVHSATKYLNGHSDVIAGVVCGKKDRIQKMMAEEFMTLGSVISPHDAWLMIRGLRTLELRVNRSSESAGKVAAFLVNHPKVKTLHYPFATTGDQLELAKKQMKQGGGLISVSLNVQTVEQAETFCNSLKRFIMATSWGGYESLVFPICALAASKSFENPLPWNLVRLYIGIEDADLLMADLKQALDRI